MIGGQHRLEVSGGAGQFSTAKLQQTGTVAGNISALLLNGADCGFDSLTGAGLAVYLYEGHDAITGDVQVDDQGQSVDVMLFSN